MLEHSTGELLASPVSMHHDNQGHDALKYFVALKGVGTGG